MQNFTYYNPVKIVFGKGTIGRLCDLIPEDRRILMIYGGGSIKRNGVYEQVADALADRTWDEFSGIEPNPLYETSMDAVHKARAGRADFMLAVGGGSVLDATKFICAALRFEGEDPWDILSKGAEVKGALPFGAVLTLPASGSEMNVNAVISRKSPREKLAFGSEYVFPKFSILDPETTFTLPPRQTANGVVDAFVHVAEQYLTFDVNTPLQDRQAEAILKTLIAEGPRALETPQDYDVRANIMWAATLALNGIIACGVVEDWSTHMISHELTALYGIDHAQALAVVLPGMLAHQSARKRDKLLLFAERVWGLHDGAPKQRIAQAIEKTARFFESLGLGSTLTHYGIGQEACKEVGDRLRKRNVKMGEHGDLTGDDAEEVLYLRVE